MVSRKILNNVLRGIVAGKMDPAPIGTPDTPPAGNAPQSTDPGQPPAEKNPAVQAYQKKYYFYDAPAAMDINFPGLSAIMKSPPEARDPVIKKLQANKFMPAFFQWKKVMVATNRYSTGSELLVVYECDLNQDGSKTVGKEKIYPEGSPVKAESVEADHGIFKNVDGKQIINLDTSSDSIYTTQEPNSNTIRSLLSKTNIPGNNYESFKGLFDNYRIWVQTGMAGQPAELRNPDYERSKNDGVPGGYYPGGEAAFNKVAGPALQEMQQEEQPPQPSLKDKMDKNPAQDKGVFSPVDEQNKDRVEGDMLDKPTGSPMAKKFSAEENYKIKRMARNVLAGYIEEDISDKDAISTSTTVKGIGVNPKTEVDKYKTQATKNRTLAKKFDEMAQVMTQFQGLEKL